MKFEKEIIELDLYGEKHELRFPTMEELNERDVIVRQIINGELENVSDYDYTKDLLEKLGLPEEAFKKMRKAHLEELVRVLLDEKKS
ncbi:hypothetical protein KC678_05710 [Candidatus Dojkabacteria bacterium]|uniref:Phage protein n=1 Tax=Candidatus Dojkabacteria bacterium TaxID=2099670 RepID=A0A955L2N1_9BACT|nr:hypothetical protein [Candidatus Dojkabacteria bacterium]